MDSEHTSEPSTENSRDEITHELAWETLPFRLGYAPDSDMMRLAEQAIETKLAGDSERGRELLIQYYDAAIAHIEAQPTDNYLRAQLGHLINLANIKSASGNIEGAMEDLEELLAITDWGRLDRDHSPLIWAEINRLSALVPLSTDPRE